MTILVAVVAAVVVLPAVTGFPSSIWEGTPVDSVRWSPDGAVLVSGSEDYLVKIWNATTGECLKTLEGHTNDVWSVAYSPDGKQIASCSDDQSVKIWDARTGKCLKTLLGHTGSVRKVVYSPDSTTLRVGPHREDLGCQHWPVLADPQGPQKGCLDGGL